MYFTISNYNLNDDDKWCENNNNDDDNDDVDEIDCSLICRFTSDETV